MGVAERIVDESLTVVMISMHTSPLAQPGRGDAGGLNVYVRNLTNALIRAGHQVLCFTRKTSVTDTTILLDENTQSKVIPIVAGRLLLPKEALVELTTQFAETMMPVIHEHALHRLVAHSHYWLSGLVALQVAENLGCPVVHTMHTLGAAKNASAPGTEPSYRLEREAYISAKVSALIANTAVEKQELIKHTGVEAEKIAVVHPGVDHDIFEPYGPRHWPGQHTSEAPHVLFAGRLQQFKGPHVLIDALADLKKRGFQSLPVIHFTGATSGSATYDIRSRSHLLGVARQCSFSDPVTPETLASMMRAADVVAMPSVAETFGLVALEAQACGTPVIAHRAGGLTTAVADGVTGQLIDSLEPRDWADALASVVEEPAKWQQFGAAGVERAASFSWSAMADRMADIYLQAL
ncbi:MAG TPA: glycosyltransferase [Enteractinococcus helveticum]|uniref:Glycosyltransferase n=1 Tax=Enteractinococcus helveticum TaxID=1837282 RepID=A0A921FN89_9MICC|nr:glycosyltransferase [Enteractinococcus helveticum]HJF14581.1 glycosyltransferase [Enteractinococcus helveticum]